MREALRRRRLTPTYREETDGTRGVSDVFRREPASVPAVRRFVTDAVMDWKMPELADAAELVVSELTSNTVRHARADHFRVTLYRLSDTALRVAVFDRSRDLPVVQRADDEKDHGRGLILVDAVAARWSSEQLRWGKRVWAELEMPPPVESPVSSAQEPYGRVSQAVCVLIVIAVAAFLVAGVAAQR
ncbi:ATP-binding protein [Streptomyces sp. JW3]|uniref:ATP-binding protein n=1 Tax=Streptomyces sp. JW3 TaxID=3456955 RepID=UPI003FA4CC26